MTREELLAKIEAATTPEDDEDLVWEVCQALMFDGHGHGCGAFCQAVVNFRMAGKQEVLSRLRALPNDRSDA